MFLYIKDKIKSPMWKLKIKCTILESIFTNVPKQSNKLTFMDVNVWNVYYSSDTIQIRESILINTPEQI